MKILSLPDVLNDRLIRIPAYQRGYAWSEEQVEDFWLDVKSLSDDRLHFTGTLTTSDVPVDNLDDWLVEIPDGAGRSQCVIHHGEADFDTLYLVDGQQRLITATLLLLAIRNRLPTDEELRRLIEPLPGLFRLGYEIDMPSHRYLLNEIYQEQTSGEARTAYTANLQNAKDFLELQVSDLSDGFVREVRHNLLKNVVFVQNHLPPELNASVVFERMNNRGKPLSQLELLKNRLLYLTGRFRPEEDRSSVLERQVNTSWLSIYEWLGKNQDGILDDDDFLRNHWILYFRHDTETGSEIRTSAFARDLLQERFSEKQRGTEPEQRLADIVRYSESLSEAARPWLAQHWPDHAAADLAPDHRIWLNKINAIRKDSFFRPIINLLLIRDYPPELVTECLKAIERHDFVLTALVGGRATANRPHFWRRANQLFRSSEAPEKLPAEIRRRTDDFYKQDRVQKHLERVWISKEDTQGGWKAWRFLDHFLREYELYLSGEAEVEPGMRMDFVYPGRRRASDWCDGSFRGLSDLKDDVVTTSLGNIVLLQNRSAKRVVRQPRGPALKKDPNAPKPGSFAWKCGHPAGDGVTDGYLHGSFSEREVAENPSWGHTEAYERSTKMLDFLRLRWQIPLSEAKRKVLTRLQFSGVGGA